MQNIKMKSKRIPLFELIVFTVVEMICFVWLVCFGLGFFCVIEKSAIPHAYQNLCQIHRIRHSKNNSL